MQLQLHRSDSPDVRFPIIDDGLSVYYRKQGPTAYSCHSEATIPITEFGESDWLQYIDAFQEGGQIQTASVLASPVDTSGNRAGGPVPIFTGYLAAVGSTEGTNRARVRVYDPMKLLGIEADTSFSEATVSDVLQYVANRLQSNQSIFESVNVSVGDADRRVVDGVDIFSVTDPDIVNSSAPDGPLFSKNFSPNRDQLFDIIEWLTSSYPIHVWFGPAKNGNGVTLYASEKMGNQYDLTPDGESVTATIENGSLAELRPFNTLKLKGDVGFNINLGDLGLYRTPIGNSYPEVTVTHDILESRFGGQLIRTGTSRLNDVERLEEEAKSKLKQMLDEVSGGSVTTTLAPHIRPYDRLKLTPACSGVSVDVEPLVYEVQRVTHNVTPDDDNLPRSEISVSLNVDRDDISIRESTVKDVQTQGEPTDNDPTDELSWQAGIGS
jgi:hypothetical protein